MPREVGPSFAPEVLDEGEAAEGLKIELHTEPEREQESRIVSILTSDSRGQTKFRAAKPGLYFVGIEHPELSSPAEILLKTHPSKDTARKITLGWPGIEPLKVRSLSGFLDGPVGSGQPFEDRLHAGDRPMGYVRLRLSSAISEEVIESLVFGFRPLATGLYFLEIEPQHHQRTRYSMGFVPLEIDASAEASIVNLLVSHAICGSLGCVNRDGTDSSNAQTH